MGFREHFDEVRALALKLERDYVLSKNEKKLERLQALAEDPRTPEHEAQAARGRIDAILNYKSEVPTLDTLPRPSPILLSPPSLTVGNRTGQKFAKKKKKASQVQVPAHDTSEKKKFFLHPETKKRLRFEDELLSLLTLEKQKAKALILQLSSKFRFDFEEVKAAGHSALQRLKTKGLCEYTYPAYYAKKLEGELK